MPKKFLPRQKFLGLTERVPKEEPKEDVRVVGIISGDVAAVTFEGQNPDAVEWVGHVGQPLGSFIVSAHQVGGKKERLYVYRRNNIISFSMKATTSCRHVCGNHATQRR